MPPMLARRGEDLRPVLTQKSLVRRNDDLAVLESGEGHIARHLGPADQLTDNMYVRISGDLKRVGCKLGRRQFHRARFLEVAHRSAIKLQINPKTRCEVSMTALQVLPHALSHRTQAAESYFNGGGHGFKWDIWPARVIRNLFVARSGIPTFESLLTCCPFF